MSPTLGPEHSVLGVMPSEVVVLWRALVREYVTDLKIYLEPLLDDQGRAKLRISVCSERYEDGHPKGYTYCWAFKDFPAMGYSISPAQLFDLLIMAREGIVWVLRDSNGKNPPH